MIVEGRRRRRGVTSSRRRGVKVEGRRRGVTGSRRGGVMVEGRMDGST